MARLALQRGHALLGISRHVNDELIAWAHQHNAHLEQWAQDLSDTTEVANRLSTWLRTLQRADIDHMALINNAALLCDPAPLEDTPIDALIASTRVGLEAPMVLCQTFLHATRQWVGEGWRGERRIMNISSGLGRRAMASSGPYCAVKAGLDQSGVDRAWRDCHRYASPAAQRSGRTLPRFGSISGAQRPKPAGHTRASCNPIARPLGQCPLWTNDRHRCA
jgi:benzil reductase ((S)-benzoin forming)